MQLLRKAFRFSASYAVSIVLLFLLLLLTFFGTVEQVETGIHAAQQKYFESLFLVHDLFGVLPLPLPGAYLLLVLLFINLLAGGIIRAPKNWRRPGMLIAHGGILLLLLGGFVTHHMSRSGQMTLYEGDSSSRFQSYYEWEIALTPLDAPAPAQQLLIGHDRLGGLETGESRTFFHPDLPFELTLSRWQDNCRPQRAPNAPGATGGFVLTPVPKDKQAERNIAGARAMATLPDGGTREGLLFGLSRGPWVVETEAGDWAVELRRRTWELPFTIHLDDFRHKLHPNTSIPASFESTVTKIEDGARSQIEIKMNQPLRHEGYTFFQASWGPQNAEPGAPLFSTFSVVNNPADQWPLYACYIITFGLSLHFLQKLYRYLKRERRRPA